MNKKIAIAAFLITLPILWAVVNVIGSEGEIMKLHPELAPEIVVKAHRILVLRTLCGRHPNADMKSDEDIDKLFLEIVKEIS